MKKEDPILCVNIIKDIHEGPRMNGIHVCGKIENFRV